mgnify:FL=1|tara:strand:+ start:490 stop:996 length:507 start_codon:yes stop_codon:yes gene_type:complete
MYTNPSAQRVLECVREAIEKDLMPELNSETAKVTAQMIGQMLLSVERRIPVEQQWMADECQRMSKALVAAANTLQGHGKHSEAISELAEQAQNAPSIPSFPDYETINTTYLNLSLALTKSFEHLHALAGEGIPEATTELQNLRAYVQLRLERDVVGLGAMEGGLLGRG